MMKPFQTASVLIDAPTAHAARRDIKESKAVGHSQFALIHDGEKPVGGVGHKISHRHLAADQKRGDARLKTEGNENTAGEFDHAADDHQGIGGLRAAEAAKELLDAVAGHQKSEN